MKPNGSRTTLTITSAGCVEKKPLELMILKSKTPELTLAADMANKAPVTVTFTRADAAALFTKFPKSPLKLDPGKQAVFVFKKNLGIKQRPSAENFVDHQDDHVRSLDFKLEPGACGGGSHASWHVEC